MKKISNQIKYKVSLEYIGQSFIRGYDSNRKPMIYTYFGYGDESELYKPSIEKKYDLLIIKKLSNISDEDIIDAAKILMGDVFEKYVVRKYPIKFHGKIIGYHKEVRCIPSKLNSETNSWLDRYVDFPLYEVEMNMFSCGNYNSDGSMTRVDRLQGNILYCFQMLQSKGYDIPHYLLGGKTLIESGLAIDIKSLK